jgi:hypothetical protein
MCLADVTYENEADMGLPRPEQAPIAVIYPDGTEKVRIYVDQQLCA